jgi:hypothetical protein
MLDNILPIGVGLRGHAFFFRIPQLVGGVVDDPDHFRVDADGRLDGRRTGRSARLWRWLRFVTRRVASGGQAGAQRTNQTCEVQFANHLALLPCANLTSAAGRRIGRPPQEV